jgi:muconate cycloisomerase
LLTADILTAPLVYRDFQLHVSNEPGLGLTLDEERLAFFRRDKSSSSIATSIATSHA